jgi:hypothetical protein
MHFRGSKITVISILNMFLVLNLSENHPRMIISRIIFTGVRGPGYEYQAELGSGAELFH